MPYFISQTAKGWDTVKDDGTVLGSHPDKKKAIAQMVALSIAEKMPAGGELKRDVVAQVGITDLDDTLIVNGVLHQDYFDWLDHQGVKLYVVTGRDEAQRADTIDQLDEFGVQYRELIMRPAAIPPAGTNDWKGSVAAELIGNGENVKFAVDNDPVARAAYKKAGVQEVLDPKTISYDTKRDYEVEPVAMEVVEPTKQDLADELRELLGNVVSAKFLAHGAHWNVKGILFSQFHEFFGEIYQDYDSVIDPLAENIRKLDVDAPFTLPQFVADTEIDATFVGGDPVQLSLAIYKANEILIGDVVEILCTADDLAQQGIYNFLADLQDRFAKWHWQLGAVIGKELTDAYAVDVEEVDEVHDPAVVLPNTPVADLGEMDVQTDSVRFIDPTQVAVLARRGERVTKGIERRQIVRDLEIRQEGDGMTLRGYAAVFDSPSQPLPFTEIIAQGAFRDSLNSRNDVKLLWNHDTGTVLGSTRAGTLKLSEDAKGLLVEAQLPMTQAGKDAAILIQRGDVNAFSFGFRVPANGDEWPSADQRILKRVNVHEVSLVAFPAYTATEGTASVRAMTELADKIARLAEIRGVSAEELTDALLALESGDELTERQGELLTDTLGKVLKQDPEVTNPAAVLDLKKKQLDLLMKRV